jgi:ribonuclease P protein component
MDKENFVRLRKEEILRGFEAFDRVFKKSKHIKTNFLSGYIIAEKISLKESNSPLKIKNIKVGFVVSKKMFRKANERNRIKRLLKESYRLNRDIYLEGYSDLYISLILGVNIESEAANDLSDANKYFIVNSEMLRLLNEIKSYLDTKTNINNEIRTDISD